MIFDKDAETTIKTSFGSPLTPYTKIIQNECKLKYKN